MLGSPWAAYLLSSSAPTSRFIHEEGAGGHFPFGRIGMATDVYATNGRVSASVYSVCIKGAISGQNAEKTGSGHGNSQWHHKTTNLWAEKRLLKSTDIRSICGK